MSQSVWFLLVATLLNTLAHTKPNAFWLGDSSIKSAWPVSSYCS